MSEGEGLKIEVEAEAEAEFEPEEACCVCGASGAGAELSSPEEHDAGAGALQPDQPPLRAMLLHLNNNKVSRPLTESVATTTYSKGWICAADDIIITNRYSLSLPHRHILYCIPIYGPLPIGRLFKNKQRVLPTCR